MNTRPTVVLAVDAARARIFRVDGESPRHLVTLVEVVSLTRPEARIPESQRYSDSNPRSAIGGRGYQTFDDHRGEHEQEERRRFAKMIALALIDTVSGRCRAFVCASHAMYAPLREAFERHAPKTDATWHARECTMSTPHELSLSLAELDPGSFGAEACRERTA